MTDPFDRYRQSVLQEMRRALQADHRQHDDLLRYNLGFGGEGPGSLAAGEMEHGSLCLLVAEALGGDPERLLPAAASLEFLHRFDLIQSDISSQRRERSGHPPLWVAWGVPLALNAADGMFALAQICQLRLKDAGLGADRVLELGRLLDRASLDVCEAEYALSVDGAIGVESVPEVKEYLRTAGPATMDQYFGVAARRRGLLAAAPRVGALVAGADERVSRALEHYGDELAVAAQVRRDYLRFWSSEPPAGTSSRFWTYPVALARAAGHAVDAVLLRPPLAGTAPVVDVHLAQALEKAGAREATRAELSRRSASAIAALAETSIEDQWRQRLELAARHVAERGVR